MNSDGCGVGFSKHGRTCVLVLTLLLAVGFARAEDTRDLGGSWRFALDRADVGVSERWYSQSLAGRIRLPGSLPGQGVGDPVTVDTPWIGSIVDRSWFTAPEYAKDRVPGHVRVPFWLQPERYYTGAAWYQRDIEIPDSWAARPIVLFLERAHWETRAWIDGHFAGVENSLGTPHEHDLGVLEPGRHRLTLRVDNRMVIDIGRDSHSVSDHTQGAWNGIVGRIELQARQNPWMDVVDVQPRIDPRAIVIHGTLRRSGDPTAPSEVRATVELSGVAARPIERTLPVHWEGEEGSFEGRLILGDQAALWDEFHPVLHRLTVDFGRGSQRRQILFGLREVSTRGTQILVNGRPTFIRGTLECSIFPKTGHPPVDVDSWRRVIRIARAHGLNNLRFHSHCPPEAAFIAADELGMYLDVEASSWANASTTLGDGKPVDAWVYAETDRILRAYGNHPSFVLMAYGNEPGGPRATEFLSRYVAHFRARDPRRLWTSGAGWPQLPENQWHSTPDPRIQAWGAGLKSRINARPPETRTDYRDYIEAREVPVVSHEIGQWCAYPNFDEMSKYTGYLKPRNFEIFRDRLEEHGLGDLGRAFLRASGRLQVLCYKEDIESAFRTPGMGGFQLLDLHDFPGQGTATVGVLDAFWDSKGYVTAREFRRFCQATVPLARLSRRVFTTADRLEADLEVAHFGPAPLEDTVTHWGLVDDRGRELRGASLPARTVPVGNGLNLGSVAIPLDDLAVPARYRLVVGLIPRGGGERFENDWDVWVYPSADDNAEDRKVRIATELDTDAERELRSGGRVLLLIPPERVRPDPARGPVALGFSSIFWNTSWTHGQPPHTLGILCDPRHPALAAFPTESHSNWQWWYLVTHAGAMILEDLPREARPVVRVIDDWVSARRLGLLFEARVETGRLLVCSVDLRGDLSADPVRRQFRKSLLRYAAGERFRPGTDVTVEQIRALETEGSMDRLP